MVDTWLPRGRRVFLVVGVVEDSVCMPGNWDLMKRSVVLQAAALQISAVALNASAAALQEVHSSHPEHQTALLRSHTYPLVIPKASLTC